MKKLFIYLMLVLPIFSCKTRDSVKYHIIIPSKGFDNISINETNLDKLIHLYGSNFQIDTHYIKYCISPYLDSIKLIEGKTIYSISYSYDSLGLAFFFKPGISTIFSIHCKSPFKCKTEKGIIMDSSSFNDVICAYGYSKWHFTESTILKDYEGIEFIRPYNEGFPPDLTDSLKYLNSKVTEITVN
jgi:hypothetical protein